MSKPTKKEQAAACSWLKAKVEEFLKEHKAVAGEHGYAHKLETVAGPLLVGVFEGWVACRFEDVEKAKRHFNVQRLFRHERFNPYSGKFNFQGFEASPDGLERLYLEFERDVGELLTKAR